MLILSIGLAKDAMRESVQAQPYIAHQVPSMRESVLAQPYIAHQVPSMRESVLAQLSIALSNAEYA